MSFGEVCLVLLIFVLGGIICLAGLAALFAYYEARMQGDDDEES